MRGVLVDEHQAAIGGDGNHVCVRNLPDSRS